MRKIEYQRKAKERNLPELKTRPSDLSVEGFLNSITDDQKRQDAFALLALMRQVTRAEPKMWGNSIVGLGSYHYRYASGREGDWFLVGFSPRKQNLTVYIMAGLWKYKELLKSLGKCKTGKSCLYINRLVDIHLPTLRKLVQQSVGHLVKASA